MGAGTLSSRWRQKSVNIGLGDNWQSVADANPDGARFIIAAGVHRMQSVDANQYQAFIGLPGAIMNGSALLTTFTQESGLWVASGQTQQGVVKAAEFARAGYPRAGFPETFFYDDVPLKHVASIGEVVTGTFFLDYTTDKLYFFDPPAGHKIEAGKVAQAFWGFGPGHITVQNLVVEKYNSPVQDAAIHAAGPGWIIRNNTVRLNYGVGIYSKDNSLVSGNLVSNNGQMGIGGNGDNVMVVHNEIASNGFWSGISPGWEGGGTKWGETDGLVVRDNYAHDNDGYGLWTDVWCTNTLYEDNIVVGNLDGGIFHEISYAATIRNNVLVGNGARSSVDPGWLWGGAICIQNSQDCEVHGNQIDCTGAGNGITLVQQSRTDPNGSHPTTGNNIHDNVIVAMTPDRGFFGGVVDFDAPSMFNGGNIFNNNEYRVTNVADDHWAWEFFYVWSDWRTLTGFEANGTVLTTNRTITVPTFTL